MGERDICVKIKLNIKMKELTITISTCLVSGITLLKLRFEYNLDALRIVKKLFSRTWNKVEKCWYAPYTTANWHIINDQLRKVAWLDLSEVSEEPDIVENPDNHVSKRGKPYSKYSDLSDENKLQIKRTVAFMRGRRYSEKTVRNYCGILMDFLLLIDEKPINEIDNNDIEVFNQDFILKRKYSISFQRQFIGAVKIFCKAIPEVGIVVPELVRPRKDFKLPLVLSKEEVLDVLRNTRNIKHRAALAMIYAAGLRISELLRLELRDIDVDRRQIRIISSKGRKDRYVVLANSFSLLLTNYLTAYRPSKYFVEGSAGEQYSPESIRAVLRRSCQRAGINKHVTPHTLRHSYATHLLESGVDLRYIQELLGHAKPETTMIYTHVQRKDLLGIKSPLDTVVEEFAKRDNHKENILLSRNGI